MVLRDRLLCRFHLKHDVGVSGVELSILGVVVRDGFKVLEKKLLAKIITKSIFLFEPFLIVFQQLCTFIAEYPVPHLY